MMCAKKKIAIQCPNIILCEGADELYFLISLLTKEIKNGNVLFETIQVLDFGGITQLTEYLRALTQLDGFDTMVESLCVVRDAEKNADGAVSSINSSFTTVFGQSPPQPFDCINIETGSRKLKKIGFALFPGLDSNGKLQDGTLEDLCLTALTTTKNGISIEEVRRFLTSVETDSGALYSRKHKNMVHTWLSATDEYVGLKIGESAGYGAIDFSQESLQQYIRFFDKMVK